MLWDHDWRKRTWADLDHDWDLIVIGGGITGVGVLKEAAEAGFSALLLEADDFASGTSSRSSKLVHGGLRYLQTAQLRLTLESVREREYLLKQGRGLVTPLGFLYACLERDHMPGWVFGLGLCAYDLMARRWQHRTYDLLDMRELCPPLTVPDLKCGYRFFDAQTDDVRLVLRVLRDAVEAGARALNYARVVDLLRASDGRVRGVAVEDASDSGLGSRELRARVVINATGVWVDSLRRLVQAPERMRPLRGSHLILSPERLPLTRAITFLHPRDGRPVFALPWEGAILFGTTDLDHQGGLSSDPAISPQEFDYLLSSLQEIFPSQELIPEDVISTFSGLRPVVDSGKSDPSKESREYAVWDEDGLITAAGGKLTTFRLMARDTLQKAGRYLHTRRFNHRKPALNPHPQDLQLPGLARYYFPFHQQRLCGRYSAGFLTRLASEEPALHENIPGTPYSWAELKGAARSEGAVHLDDLLLRRLRLGLLLPRGGEALLGRIKDLALPELGWDETRWEKEVSSYRELIRDSYQPRG
jgi:glycerol-3-phosphate dehydrogenase